MSYYRGIPRDLFNEANLLNCWGQIGLLTLNGGDVEVAHDGEAFNIEQDESGWLQVTNMALMIHGKPFEVTRPLNSREPRPVCLIDGPQHNICIEIFDEDGLFTNEFNNFVKEQQPLTTQKNP